MRHSEGIVSQFANFGLRSDRHVTQPANTGAESDSGGYDWFRLRWPDRRASEAWTPALETS